MLSSDRIHRNWQFPTMFYIEDLSQKINTGPTRNGNKENFTAFPSFNQIAFILKFAFHETQREKIRPWVRLLFILTEEFHIEWWILYMIIEFLLQVILQSAGCRKIRNFPKSWKPWSCCTSTHGTLVHLRIEIFIGCISPHSRQEMCDRDTLLHRKIGPSCY